MPKPTPAMFQKKLRARVDRFIRSLPLGGSLKGGLIWNGLRRICLCVHHIQGCDVTHWPRKLGTVITRQRLAR